jgi:hypothetical protein
MEVLMKKLFLAAALVAGGAFAVQVNVNDLAPDFDNTIADNGFWDTTGHLPVEVLEASSDTEGFASIDSMSTSSVAKEIAVFDSRETTEDESDGIAKFTSKPVGTVINLR